MVTARGTSRHQTASLDGGGTGAVWAEDLCLTTAEAVQRFTGGRASDRPAVTHNDHGSGTAWYIATTLDDATLDALLTDVLAAAGIPAGAVDGELEIVERRSADTVLRLHTKHGTHDRTVTARGWDVTGQRRVEVPLVVPAGSVRIVQALL